MLFYGRLSPIREKERGILIDGPQCWVLFRLRDKLVFGLEEIKLVLGMVHVKIVWVRKRLPVAYLNRNR